MKAIIGGRSDLGMAGLKVVNQLERILIIPLDILMMSYESYNYHMALTR